MEWDAETTFLPQTFHIFHSSEKSETPDESGECVWGSRNYDCNSTRLSFHASKNFVSSLFAKHSRLLFKDELKWEIMKRKKRDEEEKSSETFQ